MHSKIGYRLVCSIVGYLSIALFALAACGCKSLYEQHTEQIPVLATNAVTGAVTTNLVPVVLLTPSPAVQTLPQTGVLLGPWGELGGILAAAGLGAYATLRNRKTLADLQAHIEETEK